MPFGLRLCIYYAYVAFFRRSSFLSIQVWCLFVLRRLKKISAYNLIYREVDFSVSVFYHCYVPWLLDNLHSLIIFVWLGLF